MTLHTHPELEQGSPEWLDARRGMVTASVVGQLVTPSTLKPANNPTSRSIVAQLASERITGFVDDSYYGADMERGHFDEPRAIEAYENHYGVKVQPMGLMVRDFGGYKIGLSPDGLVADAGLVESKSRRPKKHLQTVFADAVPPENYAQCQTALLVSGREWVDYVSYSGGMHLWVKRVTPDPKWFAAIQAAAEAAERAIGLMFATYEARTLGMPLTERIPYAEEITF
jgi:hypothetical protein